jgi:ubiquinone/menaquinone biosynthesis C-methylase UbiE
MDEVNRQFSRAISDDWKNSRYYRDAEAWLPPFWGEGSPFLSLFRQLDLTNIIELACGHGRHTAQVLEQLGHATLVDVLASNIEACRQRFGDDPRLTFVVNNGDNLPGMPDGAYTALFCYDAMVHFELLDALAYLRETRRVLAPGGRALLHVSNNRLNPEAFYHANPHWRNFGDLQVMRHFAHRLGFSVLAHQTLDWSGVASLDGLLLIEKPAA